jgi:hypothetical protein
MEPGKEEHMGKLIFVADRGHFKAYRLIEDPHEVESPRVAMMESFDSVEAHEKVSERYSDSVGRFKLGGGKERLAAGNGEPHAIAREAEKRQIGLIADSINRLVRKTEPEQWYLAAAKSINNRIVDSLDPSVRSRLAKNVKSDLTKADKNAILECFVP